MEYDRKIGHEIKVLNNLLCRHFVKNIKEVLDEDATVMHVWILLYIANAGSENIFQKDIEKKFEIAKPTATSILKLMERKGLITREVMDYDERLKRICITDKGREIIRKMERKAETSEETLISGIDHEELKIFYEVLNKIKKNAESQI